MSQFEIEDGMLRKYTGPGGDVVIPAGVTDIGEDAFSYRTNVTRVVIPAGVTGIVDRAFEHCSGLRVVTIPDSVTDIGREAFAFCDSLTKILIPASVTGIGERAFEGCRSLETAVFSGTVKDFGDHVFTGCDALRVLKLPDSPEPLTVPVWEPDFADVLIYTDNKPCTVYYLFQKLDDTRAARYFSFRKHWNALSFEEQADLLLQRQGEMWREIYMKRINPVNVPVLAEALEKKLPGTVSVRDFTATAWFIAAFRQNLQKDTIERLEAILKGQPEAEKARAFSRHGRLFAEELGLNGSVSPVLTAMQPLLEKRNKTLTSLADELRTLYDIGIRALPVLRDRDGAELPPYVPAFLLTVHTQNGEWEHAGFCPDAAGIIAGLDRIQWQNALRKIYEATKAENTLRRKRLIYPVCRYAEESLIREILGKEPVREDMKDAVCYNDSRTAMMWSEKQGLLKRYAELRAVSEETIRLAFFSDPGLDETGCRTFDLGGTRVTARLQKDLSYTLALPDGKQVRSFPKKNADPEKREQAVAAFTELKQQTRQIAGSNADSLLQRFLSGETLPGDDWKKYYPVSPLLRQLAELIVWAQEGDTFILREDGKAYGVTGAPFIPSDKPVAVAHPMEMGPALTKQWQDYFITNGLKQPFEQVWEPVMDPSLVKGGRYDGCPVPLYALLHREKHGISVPNDVWRKTAGFRMKGCSARLELYKECDDTAPGAWVRSEYEIKDFSYTAYTRQVNRIVSILDRVTISGRIQKDDISVIPRLDSFTLPQILDFIELAAGSNAVNVSAKLLAYKQTRFGDTDPMAEFILDL